MTGISLTTPPKSKAARDKCNLEETLVSSSRQEGQQQLGHPLPPHPTLPDLQQLREKAGTQDKRLEVTKENRKRLNENLANNRKTSAEQISAKLWKII